VPATNAPPAPEKPKIPQTIYRLRTGYDVTGHVEMRIGNHIYIRTTEGKQDEIDATQIISQELVK